MSEKLWLIKDKKGRIQGPYSESQICEFIELGKYDSNSFVSSYPYGKWKPLSTQTSFYEALLKVLDPKKKKEKETEESTEAEEEVLEPTVIFSKPIKKISKLKKNIKIQFSRLREAQLQEEEEEEKSQIIDMEDAQEAYLQTLFKALRIPLLVCSLLVLVLVFVFFNKDSKTFKKNQVHLLAPEKKEAEKKEAEMSPLEREQKFKKVALLYLKSSSSYYIKAQNQLVSFLERAPNDKQGYVQLCLIHLELWPFSYQDSTDKKALIATKNQINQIDKGGIYSGLCRAVEMIINGKYKRVLAVLETSLEALKEDTELSPVFFYYLKAKVLVALGRGTEAISYLEAVQKLLPNWVNPFLLQAHIFYNKENYSFATKVYQKIISISPENQEAQLRLGVIEYKFFKKIEKSEKRLTSAFANLSEFINPQVLTEAYVVLAEIALKQNKHAKALKHAKKAYSLDPSNTQMAHIISQGEGKEMLQKAQMSERDLIYRGDILVGEGKCAEAQVFYKKAFLENKKNALAALRMAKCFWKSGISGQAIRWLKRATLADSQVMEVYFLLAEYLSKTYSFEEASEVLNVARQKNPNNYEVFKGYALLAYRQKNYTLAINYGKRALKLYSYDSDLYVILSKAYQALGKTEAEHYALKAIEEDINNVSAHIAYALSLEGFLNGENYFKKLISSYPFVREYRQALGEYYYNNNKLEEAEYLLSKLLSEDANFKPAHIYLARVNSQFFEIHKNKKRFELAKYHFYKTSLLDPSDSEALFYLAQLYMLNEQHSAAEDIFRQILQINSNYPLIHYSIGRVNLLQGGEENLQRAIAQFQIEIEKNPKLSAPYILLGDTYKKKAEDTIEANEKRIHYEKCTKAYQKAVKLRPKDSSLYSVLIKCYVMSGELDSALQFALKLQRSKERSGVSSLYRELGYLYELKGEYVKAKEKYEEYFSLNPGAPDREQITLRLNRYFNKK